MSVPIDTRKRWHLLHARQALEELRTSEDGLSLEEAAKRLRAFGPNELEKGKGVSPLRVFLHQFQSPLIYILLVAAVVTYLLDKPVDTFVILGVVILNSIIGFSQEYKAEQALRALSRMVAPRALVVRDATEREIDAAELVPGDLVILTAGDRVPADLRLVRSTEVRTDESVLTGESQPVAKSVVALEEPDLTLGDQTNMVFLGTSLVAGRGAGVVVRTGRQTVLGQISRDVSEVRATAAPLQRQMARLGRWIAVAVGGVSAVIFVLGLLFGATLLDVFTLAVAVAVASVPEGLPVVLTVALAVGVTRMARRRAIVRKLPSVETLGSCTVICSDKTGTLTKNEMTVRRIFAAGRDYEVTGEGYAPEGEIKRDGKPVALAEDPSLELVLRAGLLCNEAEVYEEDGRHRVKGDPTEGAILVAARKAGLRHEREEQSYPLLDEIPFESERQYMATLHAHDGGRLVFVKGAPERVIEMCADYFVDGERGPLAEDYLLGVARSMANRGLRVLGLAFKPNYPASDELWAPDVERGLTFLGFQAMLDPPRPEAIEAVARCRRAGIRVVMITGDHATTARAVAERMGIVTNPGERTITGREIERMSDDDLLAAVDVASVFARTTPHHKLRIVQQLIRRGEIVAVTGDGVNDAPALRAAHIGVAMGQAGTDVAREAADIVLSDDNFATIYAAVEEGRAAFANIRKVVQFLLSTGLGLVAVILAAMLLLGEPLLFTPVQILWINLVTKGFQDVGLAFEPAERGLGERPPRDPSEGVINPLVWQRSLLVGITLAVGTLAVYVWQLDGISREYARSLALTTMVFFQFAHVFNSRSDELSAFRLNPFSNRPLLLGLLASIAVHLAALYWGPLRFLLETEPLRSRDWLVVLPLAITVLVAVEIEKALRGRAAS